MLRNLVQEDFFGVSYTYIANIVLHQLACEHLKEFGKIKIYMHAKNAVKP